MKRFLLIIAAILATSIAIARSDGIYNPSANSIGDYQGIDSNKPASGSTLACSYSPVTTGTQSVAYTGATPAASGGTPAYTFSETGALPTGLTINTATGVISGTPSVNGSFPGIQVKVTDSLSAVVNCGSPFTLVIAPAGFQGPGDIVSGATTFYSCRAYSAAKVGTRAYRIIRASDSTQTDINSLASGKCDTATPATFCTATTCSVVTYYDQTGALACAGATACDVSVTPSGGATNVPLTLSALNGWPCGTRTATGAGSLTSATNLTLAQPLTYMTVAERTGNTTLLGRVFTNSGSASTTFGYRAAVNTFGTSGGTAITQTASDGAYHAIIGVLNSPTGLSNTLTVIDGVAGTAGNGGTGTFTGQPIAVTTDNGGNDMIGNFCEGGIWPSALNATQYSNLNSNMHDATNGWNF